MKDGAGLLRAIDAGELRAMGQPVEAGQDGDGEIGRRGAGEIDHGVAMRTLGEIGVDHLDLPGGLAQQFELVPGHRDQIAQRLQPGVIPDVADVAVHIGQGPLAGRIDQPALVGVGEVFWNALLQVFEDGMWRKETARRILARSGLPGLPPIKQIRCLASKFAEVVLHHSNKTIDQPGKPEGSRHSAAWACEGNSIRATM